MRLLKSLAPLSLSLALLSCATSKPDPTESIDFQESTPALDTDPETSPETALEPMNPPERPNEAAAATDTAPATTPSATPAPRRRSGRNHSIPFYLQKKTWLGVQFSGALSNALGSSSLAAKGGTLSVELQPPWTQVIGIIGLGANFSYFKSDAATRLLGYGAQFSYQARWFPNQWIVPVVTYSLNSLQYALSGGASGTLSTPGLTYGARLFLSALDPGAAAEFYNGYKVSRAYLTIETGTQNASNADLSLGGRATTLGLRLEF